MPFCRRVVYVNSFIKHTSNKLLLSEFLINSIQKQPHSLHSTQIFLKTYSFAHTHIHTQAHSLTYKLFNSIFFNLIPPSSSSSSWMKNAKLELFCLIAVVGFLAVSLDAPSRTLAHNFSIRFDSWHEYTFAAVGGAVLLKHLTTVKKILHNGGGGVWWSLPLHCRCWTVTCNFN